MTDQVTRLARTLAADYRDLAEELMQAAATLDKHAGETDALPIVSNERFTQVMKHGIVLRYVADHKIA